MTVTTHYNTRWDPLNPTGQTDWDQLATDLNAIMQAFALNIAQFQITTKLYDLDNDKPRPVKAEHTANQGAHGALSLPRELALCLSFYADRNLPRQRGRLYMPVTLWKSSAGVRPAGSDQTKLLDLADSLSGLGGANVDWCVYSRVDNVHRKVTNAWADKEWDTVRSRGLKGDSRQTRSVSG